MVHACICEDAARGEIKTIDGLLLKLMSSFNSNFNSGLLIASLTVSEEERMMIQ